MLNWFLVYTKPHNEDSVAGRLCNAGFEVLNPKLKERKYYRRKLVEMTSPLFPCYIFVKFDRLKDYHLMKYTRGVRFVLKDENGPAAIKDEIISSIVNRMENGVITIKAGRFKPGDAVIVKGGHLEGFEAVFEKEMKGIERVSILLKAINIRVIVDGALLEKSC